jgi:pyridoxal 5'-phosphate synthase pdxT subunit
VGNPSTITTGVLALQGAFAAHARVLAELGARTREVRLPHDLDGIDALVMPGGESTTMAKLLDSSGLREPLAERLAGGLPTFGTCAGMIMLARRVLDGRPDQWSFGLVDIAVRRNGYGRQVDSFEADLAVAGLDGADGAGNASAAGAPTRPFHAVFIRAPKVVDVGPAAEVLASHDGVPVLVRQDAVLVASFHPELSGDGRLHRHFLHRQFLQGV